MDWLGSGFAFNGHFLDSFSLTKSGLDFNYCWFPVHVILLKMVEPVLFDCPRIWRQPEPGQENRNIYIYMYIYTDTSHTHHNLQIKYAKIQINRILKVIFITHYNKA